jgi:hypothetical protein
MYVLMKRSASVPRTRSPVAREMMRVRWGGGAGEESVEEAELTFTAFELVTENSWPIRGGVASQP